MLDLIILNIFHLAHNYKIPTEEKMFKGRAFCARDHELNKKSQADQAVLIQHWKQSKWQTVVMLEDTCSVE